MNTFNCEDDFRARYAEEKAKFAGKRPNVLVCGYSGSGKTSLIKAICGDVVADAAIGHAQSQTLGFDLYENEHIRIWDSKGLEAGQTEDEFIATTQAFLRKRQQAANLDEHVHIVWYVVQGPGARVTDCDLNLIREVFGANRSVVVITKSDVTRLKQLDALTVKLVQAGIVQERIVPTSDLDSGAMGCKQLVDLTYRMLPAAYKECFIEAQNIDKGAKIKQLYGKRSKAAAIIGGAATAAIGIGAVPIPVADAGLLIPTQTAMIASLAALYDLRTEALRHAALPFVARVAGLYAASSLLKLLPGLGNAISATVAGSITAAVGWYSQSCFFEMAMAKINGEPIPTMPFSLEALRAYYQAYGQNPTAAVDASH